MSRSITANSVRPTGATAAAKLRLLLPWCVLVLVVCWSYWPTLTGLWRNWQSDDNYSVGQLVPLAAIYLAWLQRRGLAGCTKAPCWWGVLLLLLAEAGRAFGLLFVYESAERYSLVLTIVALVLLVAGRQVFWRARWILLFLFLMVPLPGRIHNMISGPLQGWSTVAAVTVLELAGVTVAREGHIMVLNDTTEVAVAEACSGLRMLTAFVVVAAVLAFVVNRPRWQRSVLVCSSVPISVLCNLIRLVITAGLFMVASSDLAERFFHDFAGLFMMPLAVFILVGELWIMSRLVIEDHHD